MGMEQKKKDRNGKKNKDRQSKEETQHILKGKQSKKMTKRDE